MAKCIQCGIEDVKGRSRYCSGACRVARSRKSVTESVTEKPESVTTVTKSVTGDVTVPVDTVMEADMLIYKAKVVSERSKAVDTEVQAIWDRRDGAGEAAVYVGPFEGRLRFEKKGEQ